MAIGGSRAIAATGLAIVLGLGFATPAIAADEPDEPKNPASVSIIMPITVPVTTDEFVDTNSGVTHAGTFLSAATLEQETSPGGGLATQLDAVINRGVTLAIDPMVLASIRRLGTSAPQSAVDWLGRLSALTNDTFTLTYADSDITAPLQAGRSEVLKPASLDFAIDPTLFAPVVENPDATASPSNDEPLLPTTADLLAWNSTVPSVAWPQTDSVIASDLAAITDSGYATTILASKNVSRSPKTTAAATIDGTPVLITDETISSLLDSTLASQTESTWESSMQALGASITSYSQRGLGTTLLLSLDRTEPIDATNLARTVDAIDDLTEADIVPLHEVAAGPSRKATLVDQPQSETRVARVEDLLLSSALDRQFAQIADSPKLITGERRLRLLVTLSPAATQRAGGWGASTVEFLRESSTLRGSVQLEQSSEFQFFADRNTLPVYVTNDLDQAVTVYVTVRPSLPLVAIEDDRIPVTVDAKSTAKVNVPVQSLSNGEVELRMSLHTSDDLKVRVDDPIVVALNVRAGWEGPVTVVVTILVVLLFLFGIFRTIVRRRAAARLEPEATSTDE